MRGSKSSISAWALVLVMLVLGDNLVQAAIMAPNTKSFEQPTFNFDFSSLRDQGSAKGAMTDMRSSWGNFFSERPKPVFTDQLTNVVKGSENELRGTQNEIEGSKNKVIGMDNSLFGD